MESIIPKVISILLLIAFGYVIHQKKLLKQTTEFELRKGIINVCLPAILFITFMNMDLNSKYFLVILISFLLQVLLLSLGILIKKIKIFAHSLIPFIVSGCTFGLLGISLYGTVFGIEKLGKISILGVGHELFIWFVYITYMRISLSKKTLSLNTFKTFIRSPIIIGIFLGMTFNIIGISDWFQENLITAGIFETLNYLGCLATPLILIVVGYGLKFNMKYMKKSVLFLSLRLVVTLSIGYLVKLLIIDRLIVNDIYFDYAFYTFIILPPPLSMSLFAGEFGNENLKELANNTTVLSIVVSVIAFISFVLLTGAG